MRRGARIAMLVVVLVAAAGLARAEEASVLLEKGIYTEQTLGDPSAAIPLFEQILELEGADRQIVAQAHYHLGLCHRKVKHEAEARRLLRQFVQEYGDQTELVAKARPVLEELSGFDPATLMPPETLIYAELGSPGDQLAKILKMLEGTPLANPLETMGAHPQPTPSAPEQPSGPEQPYGPSQPGQPTRPAVEMGPAQIVRAFLNPSMIKEFQKIRSAAVGITRFKDGEPDAGVVIFQPGESDAVRGILRALITSAGQPVEPIAGMQVVDLDGGEMACAFDEDVFILARPMSQLVWAVRQYQGAGEASLASDNPAFNSLAPVDGRRRDLLTLWADPARLLEAFRSELRGAGDVTAIVALADIPHMTGAVARVTLLANGASAEVTVAYQPDHLSYFYDMFRTPPMEGLAFSAVPQNAWAMGGMALLPPGTAQAGAVADEGRANMVRRITGLDLGRELYNNIQEVTVFLTPPGEGREEGSQRGSAWLTMLRALGVVIVSRDPGQTHRVLDRLLVLPELMQGKTVSMEAVPTRTRYTLGRVGRDDLAVLLGQEGHTTVLAFHPNVRDASLAAIRQQRSAKQAGPFAKILAGSEQPSKVAAVSAGGLLRAVMAMEGIPSAAAPAEPNAQPSLAENVEKLAEALDATTLRLETTERDEDVTVRLVLEDLPPLKEVFPLVMQIQGGMTAHQRAARKASQEARAAVETLTPPPSMRSACDRFVDALGQRDADSIGELVQPGSAAGTKVGEIMERGEVSGFRVREIRRNGERGLAVALDEPGPGVAPRGVLTFQLAMTAPSVWRVTDVEYVALAPVLPLPSEAAAEALAPSKLLRSTAGHFVNNLGRRDEGELQKAILPGSAAETKAGQVMTLTDFSRFRVREVRRNGERGLAVALDDPAPGTAPAGVAVVQLVMTAPDVWRVTDVDYVPLGRTLPAMPTPPSAGARVGVPAPTRDVLPNTVETFLAAMGRGDKDAVKALVQPGSPAEAKVADLVDQANFSRFGVWELRQADDWAMVRAMDNAPAGQQPVGEMIVQLRRTGDAWRVSEVDFIPMGGTVAPAPPARPKTLKLTAVRFLEALQRGDEAAVKAHILPGSPAEAQVPALAKQVDLSKYRVQSIRRVEDWGMARISDQVAGSKPTGEIVIQLRMVEEAVWRVTHAHFVAITPDASTGGPQGE